MTQQCLGTRSKGGQCRVMVKGDSSYCHHHKDRCPPRLAPIAETPYLASPQARPIIRREADLGLLEEMIKLPIQEFEDAPYDQLYDATILFGFDPFFLPPSESPNPDGDRDLLLSLIQYYIDMSIEEDILTPIGLDHYRHLKQSVDRQIDHHVEETESCCVCMDEEIPTRHLLECRHPVCTGCLNQLNKDECPYCRAPIRGPTVTPEMIQEWERRKDRDRVADEQANLFVAMALNENPDANPVDLYDRFYERR